MTDNLNPIRGKVFKGPSLHVYDDYGWLRGFGVVPSWGTRIEDAWLDYDGSRMREEIAPAKRLHANCIRLWIEFSAWIINPEKVTANFHDAVAAIGEAGMKVMPCLFNRWHDWKYDYGGTYVENFFYYDSQVQGIPYGNREPAREYIRALVKPLIHDDRVLIWDLCNEPRGGFEHAGVQLKDMQWWPAVEPAERAWLADVAATVRECGARQPITIGTASAGCIRFYADLCDVLCNHLYAHDRATLQQQIAETQALQRQLKKPLLVNECIPGAQDDLERGALASIYDELLAAAGFGWVAWCLREGKAVATRRDRADPNGLRHFGFHPWVLNNGQLRDGLESLTDEPKRMAPWLKCK